MFKTCYIFVIACLCFEFIIFGILLLLLIFMDPCIVVEIINKMQPCNGGIINYIARLHLVGYFY